MTWTVVPRIHNHKLIRKPMKFAEFFPSDKVEPYTIVVRPRGYNDDFLWVNSFGLDAIFHEPIECNDDTSPPQTVRQHAGQHSCSQRFVAKPSRSNSLIWIEIHRPEYEV